MLALMPAGFPRAAQDPATFPDTLYGLWVVQATATDGLAEANSETARSGNLAIWETADGINLTWAELPPIGKGRATVEFALDPDLGELETLRSELPWSASGRVQARIIDDRLVLEIENSSETNSRLLRYDIFPEADTLILRYRLLQGEDTLESSGLRLRRLKVVM